MASKPKKSRKARTTKTKSRFRAVVAHNVRIRLKFLYGEQTHKQWAKLAHVAQGTLQRTLTQGAGLNIETLEQIAKAVDLDIPQLFLPLANPEKTGEVIVLASGEKAAWEQFLKLKKDLGELQ